MGQVFISYRRNDQPGSAGRLFDRLDAKFKGQVFMDVDGISGGQDFTRVIDDRIELCDVVLAIIGDRWLSEIDEATGKRRINADGDFVRRELEAAIRIPDRVIPVLLVNVKPLRKDDLPAELAGLSDRQGLRLEHARFNADAEKIIAEVEKAFKRSIPWDRKRFLAATNKTKGVRSADNFARLLDWVPGSGLGLKWGSGAKDGSFLLIAKNKERSIFYASTNGNAYFFMPGLEKAGILTNPSQRIAAIEKLNRVRGISLDPQRALNEQVGFPISLIDMSEMESFLSVLGEIFSGNLE